MSAALTALNQAQAYERDALRREATDALDDKVEACHARTNAAEQWLLRALGYPDGSAHRTRDIIRAETNARALAANADRLADALSALRGRAG